MSIEKKNSSRLNFQRLNTIKPEPHVVTRDRVQPS